MREVTTKEILFPVQYHDATVTIAGRVFEPAVQDAETAKLPPVVFNSGFTGGVSMYGQLFGRAMAERGYRVMTYDVAGFFTNREVRNTIISDGKKVTNVSLEDQKDEVLGAADWVAANFGGAPVVMSWAMGSVASLAAVVELAQKGKEQIKFWVPMSYTSMNTLQNLRENAAEAHGAIMALDGSEAIPPFDTGTQATKLGYYPLDPATQNYVDVQLGNYTEAGGVDRWPGCELVTAASYQTGITFNPEDEMQGLDNLPAALIIHGADNTLHMPEESIRLHATYPGDAGDAALIIPEMMHGQQNQADHPVFKFMIDSIDNAVRAQCVK